MKNNNQIYAIKNIHYGLKSIIKKISDESQVKQQKEKPTSNNYGSQSFNKGFLKRRQMEIPEGLIHAAFFFVDIVGLSDPSMSTSTQTVKIKMLNKFIKESNVLKEATQEELIILPTGDGMFIGFVDGLEQPLKLAIELQEKLEEYNKEKPTKSYETIEVRIGCHVGNVFVVEDISGTKNVWGPGIIMARRVMDLGDGGHILMTSDMAENIMEVYEEYREIIYPLHDYQIKHGQTILLYSVFSEKIGNPKRPKKGFIEESKFRKKLLNEIKNNTRHTKVELSYLLKDFETNFIGFHRKYEFVNKSEEPIYKMINGIMTNSETSFNELKLDIRDQDNQKLKIIGINVDTDHSKEFSFKLNEPIYSEEKGQFTISYIAHEPRKIIENYFFLDSDELEISFEFNTQTPIEPKLVYKKSNEEKLTIEPIIKRKGENTIVTWKKNRITSNDMIRMEW